MIAGLILIMAIVCMVCTAVYLIGALFTAFYFWPDRKGPIDKRLIIWLRAFAWPRVLFVWASRQQWKDAAQIAFAEKEEEASNAKDLKPGLWRDE